MRTLIALFWTPDDVCPGFQSQGGCSCLHSLSPVCNGILRFIFSVTPVDLLVASMADKPFKFTWDLTCHCLTVWDRDRCSTDWAMLALTNWFNSLFVSTDHNLSWLIIFKINFLGYSIEMGLNYWQWGYIALYRALIYVNEMTVLCYLSLINLIQIPVIFYFKESKHKNFSNLRFHEPSSKQLCKNI